MSRILVADSSPISASTSNERKTLITSGNRMAQAMGSSSSGPFGKTNFSKSLSPPNTDREGNGRQASPIYQKGSSSAFSSMAARINSKSERALPSKAPPNDKAARRERSSSIEEIDTQGPLKRFKSDLEQFAYNGKGGKDHSTIVIDDDDDDELSSVSSAPPSAEDSPVKQKKKKRFVLGGGGGKRSVSRISDSEDEDGTAPTSLSALSEDSDKSEKINSAAKSIAGLHPTWEMDKIVSELQRSQQRNDKIDSVDVMRSLKAHYEALKARPAASQPANGTSSKHLATPPPPKTQSLIKRPIGKGIQVTSRASSASPIFVSHKLASPKPQPLVKKDIVSKPIQRVKSSNNNSARSSISISDNDSDDESGSSSDGGYEREKKEEKRALEWFTSVDERKLMDTIGVNEAQADIIIGLRPFTSVQDVEKKLSSTKGVTARLFVDCVALMSGLQRVDGVLEKCENMGSKLNKELDRWRTASTSKINDDEFHLRGQPEGLSKGVELKDFQLHGVNWLHLLYRKECSGILADDMGLGKTAQVLAFLNIIVKKDKSRPHLIVVPSSVLTNWMREFAIFAPTLRVHKYHGSMKERRQIQDELKYSRKEVDVIITTYNLASGDHDNKFFKKYNFDACIYDEGHILKNQNSKNFQKLVQIGASWRLLLTGTPLQNNLGELVSLLKFIMPSYFRGADEALRQIFKVNQQSQLSKERVTRAKKMMQPFVLRRKKVDVLQDLKPKTEVVKYCDMTVEQAKIYKEAYAKSRAALLQQEEEMAKAALIKGTKPAVSKTKSGHVLMELRKAANHPLLFRRIFTDAKLQALARDYLKNAEHADEDLKMKQEDFSINSDAELSMSVAAQYKSCNKHMLAQKEWLNSGKIAALKEVIDEAANKGERLIIFSQFVQTLEIICRALEVLNITYRGFTGGTDVNARQEIVDEFSKDSSIRCFLLSTRAGGVGINLTAANWVVLFDQDFNPQNDRQAADRSYRMGQERPVTIVRLISRNTIDEQIYELGKSKLKLAERVEGTEDEVDEEGEKEVEEKVEQTLLASLMKDDKALQEEEKEQT